MQITERRIDRIFNSKPVWVLFFASCAVIALTPLAPLLVRNRKETDMAKVTFGKPLEDLFREYANARDERSRWYKEQSEDGITMNLKKKPPNEVERRIALAERAVLAHPDSFRRVRCWMVDVVGNLSGDLGNEKAIKIGNDYLTKGNEAVDNAGNMARRVREFMESEWDVTDTSMGMGTWEVGAHCTHDEAFCLIAALHNKFPALIERGILKIHRTYWGLKLKD